MLILGSQSPRRKEILQFFSIPFTQAHPSFDENSILFKKNSAAYVQILSEGKGKSLAGFFPKRIILTADTVVSYKDKVLGKPRHEEEAIESLSLLSGKWHKVLTAVTLTKGSKIFTEVEETNVLFNPFSLADIKQYYQRLSCEDKAGAYAIQGAGSVIVKKIEGCFYNVMGLPINAVFRLLRSFEINLLDFLK